MFVIIKPKEKIVRREQLPVHELSLELFLEVSSLADIKLGSIEEEGEALPPLGLAEVSLDREMAQPLGLTAGGVLLVLEEDIGAPHQDGCHNNDEIELAMKGSSQENRETPEANNGDIYQNDGERSDAVTDSHGNEGVMKVGLVGTKRTLAFEHTDGHDTECVGNRHREKGNYHGNDTDIVVIGGGKTLLAHDADDKPCH